jgi:RND superfamily putative drug exporter
MVTLPVLLVLLVILIGGVVAAGIPIAIGVLVITGALAILRAMTSLTDVSVFAVNVVSMLGLGLAVDYALLVITRFREELAAGRAVAEAVRATVATAGRTVLVSGLTIAGTLASLLLFPQVYFRSVGIAGIAVTLLAVLSSVTVLPALLAVLGHRVDALKIRLPRRRVRARHRPPPRGFWFRTATAVMRRPVPVVLVVVPGLLALAAPFLRVNFGDIDYRALPAGTESRVVAERLAAHFPGGGNDPIEVVVTFPGRDPGSTALAVDEYEERLRALPGVESADVTAAAGQSVRIRIQPGYDIQSPKARTLVSDVRLTTPPPGATVLVGGTSAKLTDLLDSLRATLPWMVLVLIVVTLVVLFLAFGSVVLPVKAVLMSALSLSASFGAVVWVFQDGHLSGLLDFTPTGAVEATQPILMFAIAFGLSTDYEVFLLSRVREEWQRTGDNTLAVATGVQRTAPIITSAAILLVVVIGAFSLSGISFIKMIGIGLVITILIDATVIRAFLVPATMRLLGQANWWAPGPLARIAERLNLEGRPAPVRPAPVRPATVRPAPVRPATVRAVVPRPVESGYHRRALPPSVPVNRSVTTNWETLS